MRQLKLKGYVLLLAAGLALAGCSHRPLYGRTEANVAVTSQLADVAVEEQRSRGGQLLRNQLMSSFGASGGTSYVLKLAVSEKDGSVSSIAKNVVDRHKYRLSVAYQLVEASSGRELASGKSFSSVAYDTVQEPVSDLQAAENARERAARELAEDLKLRVSAFFATRNS